MRIRSTNKKYKYGYVLEKESQNFFNSLYSEIGLKKLFLNKKILDLGCGFGTGTVIIGEFAKEVTGVDILEYAEWSLFSSKKNKFIKGNCEKLPFKDNTFDGVYLKDLLHHIKGVDNTLLEIKRVTKPDGRIVIVEANRYNPIFYVYVTKIRGHDHFTQNEFRVLIQKYFLFYKIKHLESYPPFRFPHIIYNFILKAEKQMNKIEFLKPIFSYNIAIINNKK